MSHQLAAVFTLLLTTSCWGSASPDPLVTLSKIQPASEPASPGADGPPYSEMPTRDNIGDYMTLVFRDLNSFWRDAFARAGVDYKAPESVWVPRGLTTDSNCGRASYPVGAFYCPGRSRFAVHPKDRIYVPLDWVDREVYAQPVSQPLFTIAVVMAHAMGHHVQRSAGILRESGVPFCCQLGAESLEHYADCVAGVWANARYAKENVNDDLIVEAMAVAAKAQDMEKFVPVTGVPRETPQDRATHFKLGYTSGDARRCQ